MGTDRSPTWSRRDVLSGLSIVAGAGLLSLGPRTAPAEPPAETTRIRIAHDPDRPILCWAPKYIAQEFLRAEGFTNVQFVPYSESSPNEPELLANGAADFGPELVTGLIRAVDKGLPILIVSGMHAGCTEVFATDGIHSIQDLRGKRIVVPTIDGGSHVFMASIIAHIGLDPNNDVEWVVEPDWKRWPEMLKTGEFDAVGAFPPQSYEIRKAGAGRTILDTTYDAPWRHYFCCMYAANSAFVRENPVATKRVLRALVKANELCGRNPELAAQLLVERGATKQLEYALRVTREIPYGAWRDYDPTDTLRFFSLRLHEAGIIKSTPGDIIANGADFHLSDELRRELKA